MILEFLCSLHFIKHLTEVYMLGFGDIWVFMAYTMCIISVILCVLYGFFKWNSDGEDDSGEINHWVNEEIKIEKPL